MLPASYGLSGDGLRYNIPLCYHLCLNTARLKSTNHVTARRAQSATELCESQATAQEIYFSSLQLQEFGAHLATYLTGIGGDFVKLKFVVSKTAHSRSSLGVLDVVLRLHCSVRGTQQDTGRPSPYRAPNAGVKNGWSYIPVPHTPSWLAKEY